MRLRTLMLLLLLQPLIAACHAHRDRIVVEHEWRLSEHSANASFIVRTPDGAYVIGGSNPSGSIGWATRVDRTGHQTWEFLDGPPDTWDTTEQPKNWNQFGGAVALPDNSTLLCGSRRAAGTTHVPVLVRIDATGKLLSEEVIRVQEGDSSKVMRCVRWGNDIAIVGQTDFPPSDWLLKLDTDRHVIWKRTDIHGTYDAMETPDHRLLLVGFGGFSTIDVQMVDPAGNTVASTSFKGGDARLVRSETPSADVQLLYADDEGRTALRSFDANLHDRGSPLKFSENLFGRPCALADDSVVAFGGTDRGTTAAVWHIYADGSFRGLLRFGRNSRYFSDAVPTGEHDEFAAVRTTTGLSDAEIRPVLTFVSVQH